MPTTKITFGKDINILLLGNCDTGKTCFINKWTKNIFIETYSPTMISDYVMNIHQKGNILYKINIHELSGNNQYKSIISKYSEKINGYIFFSKASELKEIKNTKIWEILINLYKEKNCPFILVVEKEDLLNEEELKEKENELENFIKDNKIFTKGFLASSKTGKNVNEIMEFLINEVTYEEEEKRLKEESETKKNEEKEKDEKKEEEKNIIHEENESDKDNNNSEKEGKKVEEENEVKKEKEEDINIENEVKKEDVKEEEDKNNIKDEEDEDNIKDENKPKEEKKDISDNEKNEIKDENKSKEEKKDISDNEKNEIKDNIEEEEEGSVTCDISVSVSIKENEEDEEEEKSEKSLYYEEEELEKNENEMSSSDDMVNEEEEKEEKIKKEKKEKKMKRKKFDIEFKKLNDEEIEIKLIKEENSEKNEYHGKYKFDTLKEKFNVLKSLENSEELINILQTLKERKKIKIILYLKKLAILISILVTNIIGKSEKIFFQLIYDKSDEDQNIRKIVMEEFVKINDELEELKKKNTKLNKEIRDTKDEIFKLESEYY